MKITQKTKYTHGVGLLEVVVGIGIVAIVLLGLGASLQFFLKSGFLYTEKIQSTFLQEEGVEVVRFLKDTSWSNVGSMTSGAPYYISFDGLVWNISSTPTTTNSFTRIVTFYDVYRLNSTAQIVASTSANANTLDPNTKFVTITVISPTSNVKTLSTYIANILNN